MNIDKALVAASANPVWLYRRAVKRPPSERHMPANMPADSTY
jgi:hypothetical protein